jgi:regulator of sirC expression with transglutaminase-like and TPR domain
MNRIALDEARALIALIDDPDPEVMAIVKARLAEFDTELIPLLESAWEQHQDPELQSRIEDAIHVIQYSDVRKQLRNWFLSGARDLLQGALIIASYRYPGLQAKALREQINILAAGLSTDISSSLSPMEKVKAINHVLYDLHGFRGNKQNYHAPQNSYINEVLETRRGNPLSLSIIYTQIARSLSLPVFGVNLPEHFILAYLDEERFKQNGLNAPVLFYINAFNRGAIFRSAEIELFVRQMNLEPHDEFFRPCSNEQIIMRMLHNLEIAYRKQGDEREAEEIRALMSAIL